MVIELCSMCDLVKAFGAALQYNTFGSLLRFVEVESEVYSSLIH